MPIGTWDIWTRLRPHAVALAAGLLASGLMLVWAVHNGGYDETTWYWGALLLLAALTGLLIGGRTYSTGPSRAGLLAVVLFAAYVAWSYLSVAWAQSPGDALQGSNRALLYLLVFALLLIVPWTPQAALVVLSTFVLGVGVINVVLLVRLASADHLGGLVIAGRLSAPTGYFNSAAALFTLDALAAIALAARRQLPGLLRGALLALACAGLQLGLIVQSRGWLFTLPVITIAAVMVVRDRLRFVAASVIPVAGALAPLHRLLHVYQSSSTGAALHRAATDAGHSALLICAAAFILGTLVAWAESLRGVGPLSVPRRRLIGAAVTAVVAAAGGFGAVAATHGHPFRFLSRQWNGFSHTQRVYSTGSHFADVGSGRYDFWRVSLAAVATHPIGGLGQDNFADYYVRRRHTSEEPSWTHSLQARLLAHTGIVGLILFGAFIAAAGLAAMRSIRRADPLRGAIASAAVIPALVWLIHGSVDWFWEFPALSAPALGFLGLAMAMDTGAAPVRWRISLPRAVKVAAPSVALVAAVALLGLPYLSSREASNGAQLASTDPLSALHDLKVAADLDPLSAAPGRVAGAIALRAGLLTIAQQRFRQATDRERGGWFAWLGAGLAASALGNPGEAQRDYRMAKAINSQQPAVRQALARVNTTHPLTPSQGLGLLVLAQ